MADPTTRTYVRTYVRACVRAAPRRNRRRCRRLSSLCQQRVRVAHGQRIVVACRRGAPGGRDVFGVQSAPRCPGPRLLPTNIAPSSVGASDEASRRTLVYFRLVRTRTAAGRRCLSVDAGPPRFQQTGRGWAGEVSCPTRLHRLTHDDVWFRRGRRGQTWTGWSRRSSLLGVPWPLADLLGMASAIEPSAVPKSGSSSWDLIFATWKMIRA